VFWAGADQFPKRPASGADAVPMSTRWLSALVVTLGRRAGGEGEGSSAIHLATRTLVVLNAKGMRGVQRGPLP
jgi:hypothetical protein